MSTEGEGTPEEPVGRLDTVINSITADRDHAEEILKASGLSAPDKSKVRATLGLVGKRGRPRKPANIAAQDYLDMGLTPRDAAAKANTSPASAYAIAKKMDAEGYKVNRNASTWRSSKKTQ